MAAKKKPPPMGAKPPTIHEAELASGPSGAVLKGAVIDVAAAVARRKQELNVVVCGDGHKMNKATARTIEAAVGRYMMQGPHDTAGPLALPHFQQEDPPPEGHTFYETAHLKAKKS